MTLRKKIQLNLDVKSGFFKRIPSWKNQIRDILCVSLLCAVVIAYSLPFLSKPMDLMDEGWTLLASQTIFKGSIIYRDLFIHYTPGTFYVLAFAFQLLGPTVFTSRIIMLIFNILSIVILYCIARKLCNTSYSLLACLLYVTYVLPAQISPTWPAMILNLATTLIFAKYIESNNYRFLIFSGFLIGITFMFKQNIGAYSFSTILSFLLIRLITDIFNRKFSSKVDKRQLINIFFKKFGGIALSISLVIFPVFLYFYLNNSLSHFIYDNFFWLSNQMGATILPPMPYQVYRISDILFYLSVIIILISTMRLFVDYRWSRRFNAFLLLYSLSSFFTLLHVYPRYDFPHLVPALGVVFILGCYFIQYFGSVRIDHDRKFRILERGISLILIVTILLFAVTPKALDTLNIYRTQSLNYDVSPQDKTVYDVVDYIKDHTKTNEKILVVPNSPMIYFLTNRTPPTNHALLHPWIITPEIESDLVKALGTDRVKYVIFVGDPRSNSHGFGEYYWYSKLFQNIISNWQIEKTYSNFIILSKTTMNDSILWEGIQKGKGEPTYGHYSPDRGVVDIQISRLEDGRSAVCLLLHPSSIRPTWWNFSVQADKDLTLELYYGFLYGANKTDGVKFVAYINNKEALSTAKVYDSRLQSILMSLKPDRSNKVEISLLTDSLGNSSYDWAVWIFKITK